MAVAAYSSLEIGLGAVYAVFLLTITVGFIYKLWRTPVISKLWSALQNAMTAMRALSEKETDEVSRIVEEKSRDMKVEHTEYCCKVFVGIYFPFLGTSLYSIITQADRIYTWPQDVCMLCVYCICALLFFRPGVLSWKTIDVVYLGIILLASAVASPWCTKVDHAWGLLLGINLPVLLLNIARRPTLKVGSTNLLLTASASATLMQDPEMTRLMLASAMIMQFAWCSAFPLLVGHLFERSIKMAFRHGLEMQATKEVLSAADALLKSCCDVVLELDVDGTILSEALDLRGFLLKDPSVCLRNTRLSDYMSREADKTMFLHSLQIAQPTEMGLAEAIHVRMRDADGNTLRVELMSFKFHHLDGEPRYMVGLREFSDGDRHTQPVRNDDALEDSGRSGHITVNSVDSFSTTSQADQAAVAVVDCSSRDMKIRGYSSAFRLHFGRMPPEASLADLVVSREEFLGWMQLAVNADVHGQDWPDCSVVFNLRQCQLKASCRLLRSTDGNVDLENQQLLFFDIRGGRRQPIAKACGPSRGTLAPTVSL